MSLDTDELFQESIEMVERYGRCFLRDSEHSNDCEWNELSSVMMYISDAKLKHEVAASVLKDLIQEIESSSSEKIDKDHIVRKYNKRLTKRFSELKTGEENELYVGFQSLKENNVSAPHDDSDIATVLQQISKIDPITKLPLTDPVKNIKCGHIYEKSAILELIKNKNVKCPIPGCVAASHVKKNHLVPDTALKRLLESNN